MATQFYHTRDPIENLRVRVVARKVHDSKPRGAAVGTTWSYTFRWQEKKSSLEESNARKAKKLTQQDHETQRETDGGAVGSAAQGVALCSFVDADNYMPRDGIEQQKSTTSQAPPLYLVAGASDYHLSQSVAVSDGTAYGTSNTDRLMRRLHREDTFRQMHLVLRLAKDAAEAKSNAVEDIVLATLRYYPHTGLLCATPGFSVCLAEDAGQTTSVKGSSLSTHHVTSRATGARFEYALDNENDLLPLVTLDDHRILKELQRQEENDEVTAMEQWHKKQSDHEVPAKHATHHYNDRIDDEDQKMVLLEIVSARGIDTQDPIRVEVELSTEPPTSHSSVWTASNGRLRSRTRLSRPRFQENNTAVAAFGHHAQFCVRKSKHASKFSFDQLAAPYQPTLKFAVFSCDVWARQRLRGHCEVHLPLTAGFTDTEMPLVRPLLTPQEQLEDFFLGSDGQLVETALADATETKSSSTGAVVSRLGAQTISTSGRVRIRLNIIQSRPQRVHAADIAPLPPLTASSRRAGLASGGAIKRSVEEILQAVKATKRSADTSLSLLATSCSSSSASAVSAILARLQAQSTKGTSPSAS